MLRHDLNLHRIVTRSFALVMYGLVISILDFGGAMAEQQDSAITRLRITDDQDATEARLTCVVGNANALMEEGRSRGFRMPAASHFCEGAAEEAAKRGLLDMVYAWLDENPETARPGDGPATRQTVFNAAAQNAGQFTRPSGRAARLPCPLAFDAGYAYGVENPQSSIADGASEEQVRDAQQACYADPDAATLDGLVAGIRRGQAFQRLQVAQADKPAAAPAPDLRRASAASR